MKAVVLEIRNGVAAVLKEDGTVVTTRQACAVGDTIELKERPALLSFGMRYAAAVAAAAVLLCCAAGVGSYYTVLACSYVSIDVNPSIEYALNRLNRVIGVDAVNEDAAEIVSALRERGIRNDTLSEALVKTSEILTRQAYLDTEEDYVLVNITTDDSRRYELLEQEVEEALRTEADETTTWVVSASSEEDHKKARALGISAGKYEEIRSIEADETPGEISVDRETVDRYERQTLQELFRASGRLPEQTPPAGDLPQGQPPADGEAPPAEGGAFEGSGPPSAQKQEDGTAQPEETAPRAKEPEQTPPDGSRQPQGQPPGENAPQGQPPREDEASAESRPAPPQPAGGRDSGGSPGGNPPGG